MQMAELVAYAGEKYRIEEQHKWADFPGFSVLCHPQTGKWIALLMRQWDGERGEEAERCEIKCGSLPPALAGKPYLFPAVRMRGAKWTGVAFGPETETEIVTQLLDEAVRAGTAHGFTLTLSHPAARKDSGIVIDAEVTIHVDRSYPAAAGDKVYHDTPLPFSDSVCKPPREDVPEALRQMRRLYEYGRETPEEKARNFVRQGLFMQDYEDDADWEGDFVCFYPSYHDLSLRQLRAYFGWRTRIRHGEYRAIPASVSYLYIYELLNGIGAASPEDSIRKLKEFEHGFLDSGLGPERMRRNLRRWMMEYAIVHELPVETVRSCADPDLIAQDDALAALREPTAHSDSEVLSALLRFGGNKLAQSPVFTQERSARCLCEAWRIAAREYRYGGNDLFTLCFGSMEKHRWYPLSNALFLWNKLPAEMNFELDPCRIYRCRLGLWQLECYDSAVFDKKRIAGFLHEADRLLRRYFKTGRYLREKPEDAWASPYINAAIEKDRREVIEASRPKVTIDLSGLDRIRRDAMLTRDSLLTEEERSEAAPGTSDLSQEESKPVGDELPLDAPLRQLMLSLLRGEDPGALIRQMHWMPSLVADTVNEALYDEIGDTVLLCEEDRLFLVEDYRENLEIIFGGNK